HSDPQVIRGEIVQGVEGARPLPGTATGCATQHLGSIDITQAQIAIGELDLEVVADVVGESDMRGPCKIPLRVVVGGKTEGGSAEAVGVDPNIAERRGDVVGGTGADPHERGQAPPGPQVEIDVGQQHDCGMAPSYTSKARPSEGLGKLM